MSNKWLVVIHFLPGRLTIYERVVSLLAANEFTAKK